MHSLSDHVMKNKTIIIHYLLFLLACVQEEVVLIIYPWSGDTVVLCACCDSGSTPGLYRAPTRSIPDANHSFITHSLRSSKTYSER